MIDKMLKLKGCPKCGGDIQLDKDHYGWFEQCFQCGFLRDLPDIAGVKPQLAEDAKELTGVGKGEQR